MEASKKGWASAHASRLLQWLIHSQETRHLNSLPAHLTHAGKLSLRSPRDMPRVMSSRRPCGKEGLGQRAASPFQGTSKIASSHWKEQSGAVSLLPRRPQEDATLSAVTSGGNRIILTTFSVWLCQFSWKWIEIKLDHCIWQDAHVL